ncbi:MAG: hypothetical protein K2M95_00415 [Clostridiales bacterium]|nr:hypothetical protein [Clostridiales bacterium]
MNKKRREADAMIMRAGENGGEGQSDPSVIGVKIGGKEQLYSAYSYSGDKLNPEFSNYVLDKAKGVPIKEDIKIRIYSAEGIDAGEVEQTLKSHYCAEYKETKKEIKRLSWISVVMTLLGIVALTALILVTHFTENLYITSIVEIAAWVFIWEAVDYFFLQRPVVKAKCILIQRIYTATVEVCKGEQAD